MISGDDGGSATSASRAESPSGCPSWTLLRSGDDAEDNCQLFLSQLRSNYQAELKHEMSTAVKAWTTTRTTTMKMEWISSEAWNGEGGGGG